MTEFLADGNVLIALTVHEHVHHRVVREWFSATSPVVATCPITQGTLLRFLLREGVTTGLAMSALTQIQNQDWHRFWPDALPYDASLLGGVIGHRQVTDAYLVGLATHFGGSVVTLDRGLAALHGPGSVHLIDVS